MKGEELKRINSNNNGEIPKDIPKIIITAKKISNPKEVLEKTKEIMKAVSKYAYTDEWPTDDEWSSELPEWFVNSMKNKTIEEIMTIEGQWHYESWIANVKDRAWLWWSSKIDGENLVFVLEALSIPYLYSTFVYILYSQGIPMEDISVEDDVYDVNI